MTNSKWFGNSDADPIADIMRRINAVESYANDLERRLANLDSPQPLARVDPATYLNPYEGQRAIDPSDEQHMWYSNGMWRKGGGGPGIYAIEVFEADTVVKVLDNKFEWEVPEDLDGSTLVKVDAYLTAPSTSGTVQVMLSKESPAGSAGADLLSTKINIDVGEYNMKDAATQPVINTGVATFAWGDHIRIDIDNAGTGAKGLGIIGYFVPNVTAAIAIQGAKGDPGGVTNWSGTWTGNDSVGTWTTATGYTTGQVVLSGGTYYVATASHTSGSLTQPGIGANWATVWQAVTYVTGEAVNNNGTTYISTVDHTATTASEPGVGANWQDYWMPLVDGNQTSAIVVHMDGVNYPITVGDKTWCEIPYACTLKSVTMLASPSGSIVVDIWKDVYANYPPTVADSIVSTSPPTISGGTKSTDTILSGWTTSIAAGDILWFHVNSCTSISKLSLNLELARL